jgi:hypothetical protein
VSNGLRRRDSARTYRKKEANLLPSLPPTPPASWTRQPLCVAMTLLVIDLQRHRQHNCKDVAIPADISLPQYIIARRPKCSGQCQQKPQEGLHCQSRKRANLARGCQARGREWRAGCHKETTRAYRRYRAGKCLISNTRSTIDLTAVYQIWMYSNANKGQYATALETVSTALSKFLKFAKLYMIQEQIHRMQENFPAARALYAAGLKACAKEVTSWVLASKLALLPTTIPRVVLAADIFGISGSAYFALQIAASKIRDTCAQISEYMKPRCVRFQA